jgi:hypothetical protein
LKLDRPGLDNQLTDGVEVVGLSLWMSALLALGIFVVLIAVGADEDEHTQFHVMGLCSHD